jgi:hypothetical protein
MSMKLFGPRAPLEGVKQWMKNPIKPLILWGETGVGKTTALDIIGAQEDMQSEEHENPLRAIDNARHPTFGGRGRYARLEDSEYFSHTIWSKIEKVLTHAPPIVFTPLSLSSIPYSILKQCVVIEIKQPQPRHIVAMLESHDIDPDLSAMIAKSCKSWRQAQIKSRFCGITDEKQIPFVHTKDQPKAILNGSYASDFNCHPLAVLEMASHNGVDPDAVIRGLMLHSNAWNIDGLSLVSRAFIARLRADRTDSPPFSKRNG